MWVKAESIGDESEMPTLLLRTWPAKSNEFQVATFIACIGQEALQVHNGLPSKTDEEKKDMAK